jgi:hypothetical protein
MALSRKMFLHRAGKAHRVVYDYSHVPEVVLSRVLVVCPEHGMFERSTKEHLKGKGCSICDAQEKHRRVLDKFVQQARKVHNDLYNYERVGEAKFPMVVVTCRKHGDFEQSKYSHLKGSGCPLCNPPFYRPSKAATKWLDSIGIPDDVKHREVKGLIPGRRITVDGFDPTTNTVYEFYGDEIHGNPRLYAPELHSSLSHTTYGELYQRTLVKERLIIEAGFKLVTMWKSDFEGSPHHPKAQHLTPAEIDRTLDEFIQDAQLA